MFLGTSGRCPVHWIITCPHYLEVGTPKLIGSLQSLNTTESKVEPGRKTECFSAIFIFILNLLVFGKLFSPKHSNKIKLHAFNLSKEDKLN